jgi:enolase-phosphatase E1
VILLDIEGTTTPIAFITETLFPYARARMPGYIARHGDTPAVRAALALLRDEYDNEDRAKHPDLPAWSVDGYLSWLMAGDSKSRALKDLQGRVWEEGFASGEIAGQVYDDVPRALARWHAAGIPVGIFSSGSVLAQQWLFRRTNAGDLTRFLRWHFDTGVGKKQEPASYSRIAADVHRRPDQILFVSDVAGELDAAGAAGLQTTMAVRPGNAPQPPHDHRVIRSLDEL